MTEDGEEGGRGETGEGRTKGKRGGGGGERKGEEDERRILHKKKKSFEVLEGVWKMYFNANVFYMFCTDV